MLDFLFCIATYLLGSIPIGLLVSKYLYHIDLRAKGSGNIGATNATRVLGWRGGLVVLFGDILKSILTIILAKQIGLSPITLGFMSFIAVIGHCFPVYLKLKGGKGVASTLSTTVMIAPLVGSVSVGIYVCVFLLSKTSSISSLCAVGSIPFLHLFFNTHIVYFWISSLMFVLILFTHRENIRRLFEKKDMGIKPQ